MFTELFSYRFNKKTIILEGPMRPLFFIMKNVKKDFCNIFFVHLRLLNFKFIVIMRKFYFLAAVATMFVTGANAQFTDDMESYTPGSMIYQDWWTDWGCGGTCSITSSTDQANDGAQSGNVPSDGTTDAVLDLGNKIFGTWYLQYYMYVPSNQEGYWNIQGTVPIGSGEWVMGNFFFNQDLLSPGVGSIDDCPGAPVSFTFPHDAWFEVYLKVNIEAGISLATCHLQIDGNDVLADGTPFTDAAGTVPTSLGGIDFFSISANNNYYVDTFYYGQDDPHVSGTSEFAAKGFSAYPNPVTNILNLKANEAINSVAIYNVLGQQVYSAKVNAMTSTVDMSQMASGAYFVKVNINGTEGTVKVIK